MMERIGAYEPVLMQSGKIIESLKIPRDITDIWPLCLCLVQGRVIKDDSGLPVCGAKVHICEVDKFWRWIVKIPDFEIIRFRDELLKIFDKPELHWPPLPEPDPPPFTAIQSGLIRLNWLNPQPEPPVPIDKLAALSAPKSKTAGNTQPSTTVSALPNEVVSALSSTSVQAVRSALIANVHLITPYFCLLLPWWKYRSDEMCTVETDAMGRFQKLVLYCCKGDKPDLYFWVEYNLCGAFETIYRPSIPCHTYWNYACGSDVIIRIQDDRVPACYGDPDLPGCVVQILSIGREISMSEIQGEGAPADGEGLTTSNAPLGGKLEPRIWLSRTTLRDNKKIRYYRWSYRRLTEGDGTVLGTDRPWTHITRTVVRHYPQTAPGGSATTHMPLTIGPRQVGAETDLFEIWSKKNPAGEYEWSVVDEREDLASAHFETDKLGSGSTPWQKALNAAGKYELKLELFKDNGAVVDWTAEGIDLQMSNVPAPFGLDPVTFVTAPDDYRLQNNGHTVAFRMVLRIDNNCCQAEVDAISGTGLENKSCGFSEFSPGATVKLGFRAYHPNGYATFKFDVKQDVSTDVPEASASGAVDSFSVATDNPLPFSHAYTKTALSKSYTETFEVSELLDSCPRAAFSEALHVETKSTDGYGRLWHLNAFAHAGFALTPKV